MSEGHATSQDESPPRPATRGRGADDVKLLVATIAALIGDAVAVREGSRGNVGPAYFLCTYAFVAAVCLLAVARRGRDGTARYSTPARWCAGLIAAVCVVGGIRTWSCPHATYLGIGPINVVVSGRRCGNVQPFRPFWPAAFLFR